MTVTLTEENLEGIIGPGVAAATMSVNPETRKGNRWMIIITTDELETRTGRERKIFIVKMQEMPNDTGATRGQEVDHIGIVLII